MELGNSARASRGIELNPVWRDEKYPLIVPGTVKCPVPPLHLILHKNIVKNVNAVPHNLLSLKYVRYLIKKPLFYIIGNLYNSK